MVKTQTSDEFLIEQSLRGDQLAFADLFQRYRQRLLQMLRLRLDQRLRGRVDPSDVLQEAFLDLAQELPGYVQKRLFPFFLWMRMVALQRLMRVHRQHLGTEKRDAARDTSRPMGLPPASGASLADQLAGNFTSAGKIAVNNEIRSILRQAVDELEEIDREIIALRNYEELSNREVAELLQLTPDAARKRYVRALKRLQHELRRFPGLIVP